MPAFVACGSRGDAYRDFRTALRKVKENEFIAMLVDSEDPVQNIQRTWEHLQRRDGWSKPARVDGLHVLLMVTCMETWIVADREALKKHYGNDLQVSALPSLASLERRERGRIHEALSHATRVCGNSYRKGRRSFQVLAKLDPDVLREVLPSFDRLLGILTDKLG